MPIFAESLITFVIFEHSKNWFMLFDLYDTVPRVWSLYVTYNSPLFGNPIVESTLRVVSPFIESVVILTFAPIPSWFEQLYFIVSSGAVMLIVKSIKDPAWPETPLPDTI